MDNEKNTVELTKIQQKEIEKRAKDLEDFFNKLDGPDANAMGMELAEDIRMRAKEGKMIPISMSDGTTFYMDSTGMKRSDVIKFQEGIFEWVNNEMTMVPKKGSAKSTKSKSRPEKTRPEKSRKLKNR